VRTGAPSRSVTGHALLSWSTHSLKVLFLGEPLHSGRSLLCDLPFLQRSGLSWCGLAGPGSFSLPAPRLPSGVELPHTPLGPIWRFLASSVSLAVFILLCTSGRCSPPPRCAYFPIVFVDRQRPLLLVSCVHARLAPGLFVRCLPHPLHLLNSVSKNLFSETLFSSLGYSFAFSPDHSWGSSFPPPLAGWTGPPRSILLPLSHFSLRCSYPWVAGQLQFC